MLTFEVQGIFGATWDVLGVDVRYLSVQDDVLLAATGPGGGIMTLRLGQGTPTQIDQTFYTAGVADAAVGDPVAVHHEGAPFLAVGTNGAGRIVGYEIAASGQIQGPETRDPQVQGGPLGLALTTTVQGFVYGMSDDNQLRVFRPDGQGGYTPGPTFTDTALTYASDVTALAQMQVGSSHFLIAAGLSPAGVTAFQINTQTGALTATDSVGTQSGLGLLNTPTALDVAEVAGRSFVLVASSADYGKGGALSVLELTSDGDLSVTEHFLDSLQTRWGNVQSFATVKQDGWTYVLAGGGDAGLSLLALMPNGRLVHLETISDSLETGLERVSAVSGAVVGDEMQVIVASQATVGLTHLSVDVSDQGIVDFAGSGQVLGGALNDLLTGGTGDNDLRGNAGDDILVDGAGADRLTGGAGRDLFVLQADDARDVIVDFQAGQDRLDLTGVPFLYDPSRLQVVSMSWGAELFFPGGEVTEVRRSGGGSLSANDILGAIAWNAHRPLVLLRNEVFGDSGNENLPGSDGTDFIDGGAGNDVLDGGGGDDILLGGAGNDTLLGGAGLDEMRGGAGQDDIDGGAGDDQIFGAETETDTSSDTLRGGAGDDVIVAAAGADVLSGDEGADSITGGAGNDTLLGGSDGDTLRGGAGRDRIEGGTGNDLIYGSDSSTDQNADADTIIGGAGNDVIVAAGGADSLTGDDGADSINGGAGDDTILGGTGNDTLRGGSGRDSIAGGDGNDRIETALLETETTADTVRGGAGDDIIISAAGADLIYGDTGADSIVAGAGNDTIWGGAQSDTLEGGAGDDSIDGQEGTDLIRGGPGRDWLSGGNGNDTILGGESADRLLGGAGVDRLSGEGGDDYILGGSENDLLNGNGGNDTLLGEAGNDTLLGESGHDRLEGQNGFDSLSGGFGDDWMHGGAQNDTLLGGNNRDTIFGAYGDDQIEGQFGADRLWGGYGNDWIHGGSMADLLQGQQGDDTLNGGAGRDVVYLGQGNDVFIGFTQDGWLGQDTIYGGMGNDLIQAKTGNDWLEGQLGNDTLSGGRGNDVAIGGKGRDTFIFWTNSGTDTIKDFQRNFDAIHLDIAQSSVRDIEIVQAPRGVWLDWGPSEVLLEGMTLSEFDTSDIFFI